MALDASTNTDYAAWLKRYGAGDAQAAAVLTQSLAPMIFAHAMRMLNNQADAEEVTQEALLRLWKAAPDFDTQRAKVTTWLYRVTANLCIDRIRKAQKQSGDEMPDIIDESPSAAVQMQVQARAAALQNGLAQLPERQRQAVILRFIDQRPNPDVAEIMGLTVDAVESLLSRAKRRLAQILTPQKEALGALSDDI